MLTCGSCRHWNAFPRPKAPVLSGGLVATVVDLTTPQQGECRSMPPQVSLLPGPNGAMALGCVYPQCAENFPACGQHATREGAGMGVVH